MINKEFFKKRFSISYALIFAIILILLILFFRKTAIYFILVLLTSAFVYLNYYIHLPFDLSPVLFLSLIITREYNFFMSILYIFVAGILPMVFAGGSFDHTTIFYLSIIIAVNFISIFFISVSFIIAALILIIIHHIICAFGSISFGTNPAKEVVNMITKIAVDGFYILNFSVIVISIIH
ncbi:MAG: hypothetical protein V1859_01820 [archaeon]